MEKSTNFLISNSVHINETCKLIKIQALFRGYIIRENMNHQKNQTLLRFLTLFTDFQKFNQTFSEWISPQIMSELKRQEMHFSYLQISNLPWSGPVYIDDISIYYGEVDQNFKPNGKGILVSLEYICEGTWLFGKMNGIGRRIDKAGTYIGDWNQGLREGQGTMKHSDGRVYNGWWKNNQRNGPGEVFGNYVYFKGYYKDGLPYGQGVLEYYNKYVYVGSFVGGWYEGYGIIEFPSGEKYKGYFKSGKYHGIGVLYQKDGWRYSGFWDNGARCGFGERYHPTLGTYKGIWENNKPIGKYIFAGPNNNTVKGEWTDIGHINYLDEIIPHLFLGSAEAAEDEMMLRNLGIWAILRILDNEKVALIPGFIYHYIKIKDLKTEDITKFIPEAYKFIDEWIEKGKKVLVHCRKGISRSATIVIAYIMIKKRIHFDEALEMVRNKRPIVNPNIGFTEMLKSHYDLIEDKC